MKNNFRMGSHFKYNEKKKQTIKASEVMHAFWSINNAPLPYHVSRAEDNYPEFRAGRPKFKDVILWTRITYNKIIERHESLRWNMLSLISRESTMMYLKIVKQVVWSSSPHLGIETKFIRKHIRRGKEERKLYTPQCKILIPMSWHNTKHLW